jgi:2-keto-4-pentenoate hydratase/2-oxohepta-3-ene-1,7-dioic acid hydratase in catechol pathway
VIENRVVDLDRRMKSQETLLDVIRAGALIRAKDIAAESSADYELKDIEYCSPILTPGKVVCVPLTANAAAERGAAGIDFYLRPAESLTGHEAKLRGCEDGYYQLVRPALAMIVGRGGWQLAPKHTRDAIAGIALANNGAVRSSRNVPTAAAEGTTYPACAATGPWLVTLDDINEVGELRVSCQINDAAPRQYASAALQAPLPDQISRLSHVMQLNPGDLILFELPEVDSEPAGECRVTADDRISIECSELGVLNNTVSADSDSSNDAE